MNEGLAWGSEMRLGLGGEVSKYRNILVPSSGEIFSEPRIFFVDDDSGLFAIG